MTAIKNPSSTFYFFLLLIIIAACSKNDEDCVQYDLTSIEDFQNNTDVIAHSHNDYEQICPLAKALALGFTSIEVDIFPFDGKIKVSHDDDLLNLKPTIQTLYLDPLKVLLQSSDQKINLLVDLKVNTTEFLSQLHTALVPVSYTHLTLPTICSV